MKKKIVYLMEYPLDLPGGGQMSTQTLCEGLLPTDYEALVICPKLLTHSPLEMPYRVLEYSSFKNREDNIVLRVLNFLKRINDFYRLIKREKPDLIHVSMSESLISFGFICKRAAIRNIPFIYTDRGLCYGYRSHSKYFMKKTLSRASAMICTTAFNKSLWDKEGLPVNIRVIPNTISNSFSDYEEGKRDMMRKGYGLKEDDFIIGFAGRISEEKDWDLVPVLVKSLKDAGISFKVALVISVYEKKDLQIVESIKKGIADSIGEENLLYLQDLSQKEMADYYYIPDVFVMSSSFESFGKAAVEAMSRKCAVVSTSVGGLKEVIGKEENLYSKDDLTKFTERIKRLSSDKEELDRDKEFFYKRYRENYVLDVHIKRHLSLYDEVLKNDTDKQT
ncbi:MAG: glycosyltransferase family 4 protein [Lachnospiraceae bacterium]|nr:glycosyltransferase family 4 protein [Lachnospiraceae bacterium]